MASEKLDLKLLSALSFSFLALLISLYSCHTASQLTAEALAPKLSITDLQLNATFEEDGSGEVPILHYKIQNQGHSTLNDLTVAEVVTVDKNKYVSHESRQAGLFEPGEPIDSVVYLTPVVLVPAGFHVEAVTEGRTAFSIQFETEASTDRMPHYRTCEKFTFNHFNQKFERASSCVSEVFK